MVGPKGQVVIPKEIREALSIKPGSSVVFEFDEGSGKVFLRPLVGGEEFIEAFLSIVPRRLKLRERVDLKRVIEREVAERVGLPGQ